MACAGRGGLTIVFKWRCTNQACGFVWCNNCAAGWLFRSCPSCGNRCE